LRRVSEWPGLLDEVVTQAGHPKTDNPMRFDGWEDYMDIYTVNFTNPMRPQPKTAWDGWDD
jgi:hypothetical protein